MGRATTAFVVLLYLAVFFSVFISDQLPSVPSEDVQQSKFGLNLSEAFADLQHVARRPHPYMSHANDQVREYILGRVLDIQEKARDVEVQVSDDMFSNGTWAAANGATGTYFEGTNILVKIRGSSDNEQVQGAVLFSAHYDSVSTAPGTTDDSMGVVTLLQLLSYFTTHPPLRTVIFNINNGEEDGLNGARAFLLHPWISNPNASLPASEIPTTFLNLEGAASGGRPLLFRATGGNVLGSFAKGNVLHPHANVLSADAFSRGVVRSGTDYSVYTQPCAVPSYSGSNSVEDPGCRAMDGIDIAFYRGRSKYHTKYDAVSYTDGRERALWAMMEMAWGSGKVLANDNPGSDGTGGVGKDQRSVYFDLFGVSFLIFPLSYLLTFNITTLVAGPIILILISLSEAALLRSRRAKPQVIVIVDESSASEEESDSLQAVESRSRASRLRSKMPKAFTVWEHLQFWVALAVTVGIQVAIVAIYLAVNPFFVYTYPFLVLLSNLSFAMVTFTSIPSLSAFHSSWTPSAQTRAVLLHTYIFTYILLILGTVGITRLGLGGSYFISLWNVLLWLGCVGCAIGGCISGGKNATIIITRNGEDHQDLNGPSPEDTNERTPLIRHRSHSRDTSDSAGSQSAFKRAISTIITYLSPILLSIIIIPAPLILLTHLSAILLGGLPQTLADGSPAVTAYGALALLSVLGGIFVLPFVGLKEGELVESDVDINDRNGVNKSSTPKSPRPGPGFGFGAGLVTLIALFGTGILLAAWIPWPSEWVPASSRGGAHMQGWKGGVFPFDEGSPLKVFFQQKVVIAADTNTSTVKEGVRSDVKVITTLTGATPFVEGMILPTLPSYRDADPQKRSCVGLGGQELKRGLAQCSWVVWEGDGDSDASIVPDPGVSGSQGVQVYDNADAMMSTWNWTVPSNKWIRARAQTRSFKSQLGARFRIQGQNTRACRVYFDSPIKAFRVDEDKDWAEAKTNEVRLWSRTWDREFVLDVVWDDEDNLVAVKDGRQGVFGVESTSSKTGRVACEWSEYESGMGGLGNEVTAQGGRIPAYEEVLTFLPRWAVASKLADGLVEVESSFVL